MSDASPRLSPYALAALVVGAVAATRAAVRIQPFGFFPFDNLRVIAEAVFVPVAGGIVAMWLSGKARAEIASSAGRLSGAGWVLAAKVLAVAAIVVCAASVTASLLLTEIVDNGVVRFVR